ncbi:hypothetical protein [Comamonas endophytica]|uniref:Uncharacterized protein n=1 Tax=Comamonas endophytica TaxID=2949090 RepID=A0ABY6GA46_9BURK|nr:MULTISPECIES: hypothetical protein [unclassified Acidovorax]MCD2514062.1 hypothetical protein [Acidovorax sp. D4N7]UYG51205.1 hypothetical protein M9799_14185 [Acidovorax sp. 5MLIR]
MHDSAVTTHSILLQWTMPAPTEAQAQALASVVYGAAFADSVSQAAGLPCALHMSRFAWSHDTGRTYVYADLAAPAALSAPALAALQAAAQKQLEGADLTVSRLELVFDCPGASYGQQGPVHYVVETDPAEGWQSEIFNWYDQEHMPGLAAVQGNVHARRYLNHDAGPLSLACYDLLSPDVLGCPAWLKVRATAWSDIARPHFTNTLRTMFRTVEPGGRT